MARAEPHDLNRFVDAQKENYDEAVAELRAGRKQSHWMWYVFPQLAGLGQSSMAIRYAIRSADEARAYLDHPVLGRRLIECAEAVLAIENKSANDIFGSPDDLKLRSSATLFAHVAPGRSIFARILEKYFDRKPDPRTVEKLRASLSS